MAAESLAEQVAAKLKTSLAALTAGADYWYTPDAVERISFFPDDAQLPDTLGDVVYLLHPGRENVAEEATGRTLVRHEFAIVAAKQHRVATERAYLEEAPTRWQVMNRLARDITRCLLSNVTLNGLAVNVDTDSIVIERDGYLQNWAFVTVRFTVSWFADWSAP